MITNFEHYKEEIIRVCGEDFAEKFGMTHDGIISHCQYCDCDDCKYQL